MTNGFTEGGVPSVRIPAPLPDGVSPATIGVRGGLLRSGFEETSEAIFLNSGYVYDSAEQAEKAFTGEIDRYVYSRYGNPTISMFEERLRLVEGAEAVFAQHAAQGLAQLAPAVLRPGHGAAQVEQARDRAAGQRPVREHARAVGKDELDHRAHRHLEGDRHRDEPSDRGPCHHAEAASQGPPGAGLEPRQHGGRVQPKEPAARQREHIEPLRQGGRGLRGVGCATGHGVEA